MSTGSAAVVAAAGVLLTVFGVLIRYYGAASLIAGYDPERVDDEEGLTDFVGANALYAAALALAVAVAEFLAPADWYWVVFTVGIVALAVRMVRGSRRYETDA